MRGAEFWKHAADLRSMVPDQLLMNAIPLVDPKLQSMITILLGYFADSRRVKPQIEKMDRELVEGYQGQMLSRVVACAYFVTTTLNTQVEEVLAGREPSDGPIQYATFFDLSQGYQSVFGILFSAESANRKGLDQAIITAVDAIKPRLPNGLREVEALLYLRTDQDIRRYVGLLNEDITGFKLIDTAVQLTQANYPNPARKFVWDGAKLASDAYRAVYEASA